MARSLHWCSLGAGVKGSSPTGWRGPCLSPRESPVWEALMPSLWAAAPCFPCQLCPQGAGLSDCRHVERGVHPDVCLATFGTCLSQLHRAPSPSLLPHSLPHPKLECLESAGS